MNTHFNFRKFLPLTFIILFLVGVIWSGTSWAQTNFCYPTGNETVQTDKQHYRSGEVVQITGTGYGPLCDVRLELYRPDGAVDMPILSIDSAGNFAYDYIPGGLNGYYFLLVAQGDMELASAVFTNGPIVMTDRGDYHPGETVQITGTAFEPAVPVVVQVTRPDGSIVKGDGTFTPGTDLVTPGAFGDFTHSYQLNGIFGEYWVDVFGPDNSLLASTLFTDGVIFVKNIGNVIRNYNPNSFITVTVPAPGVAAGNSIIASVRAGSGTTTVTCSDTAGNSYSQDVAVGGGGMARAAIVSAHNVKALVVGDTITCSYVGFSGTTAMSVNEFQGLSASPLDKTAAASSTASNPNSGLTATTTQADELVFGFVDTPSFTPATSGSDPLENPYSPPYTLVGTGNNLWPMYRVVNTTRKYQANGTGGGTGGWRAMVATYKVDITPPDTTITAGPENGSYTNNTSASFNFTGTDDVILPANLTFECSLDGAAFTDCTSPVSYSSLGDGSHTFQVRAKDRAGNVDQTPASRTWTVDTMAPDTSITSNPSNPSSSTSATFSFTSTEPGSTFECKLDGGSFVSCTSLKTYNGLADGSHTLEVRATDQAGNVDPTPASYTWVITTVQDTTTTVALISGTNPSNYDDSLTFRATVTPTPTGGSFTFYDGGTCASPGTLLSGPTAVNGSGQASFSKSDFNAGSYSILACYGGTTGYNASNGSVTQTVNPKTVKVTPDSGQSKVYGTSDPVLTYTLSEAIAVSGALDRASGEDVGNYAINLGTLASTSSNYTLSLAATPVYFAITPASQTITVTTHAPATAVYNTSFTVAATASSGLDVAITTSGACTGSGTGSATITMTNGTGTCTVYYNQGGSGNYNPATQVAEVTSAQKASATVTLSNLTQTYTGSPLKPTATTNPLGLTIVWTNAPQTNAGFYSVTATINDTNYEGSASGTFVINKATPAFSNLSSPTIIYGAPPTTLSGTIKAGTLVPTGNIQILLNGVLQSVPIDSITGNFSSSFATGTLGVAGSPYIIGFRYAGDANFDRASAQSTFTVNQKTASVTPNPAGKLYGDTDPAFTGTLSGFLTADGVTATYSRTAGESVGTYTINATLIPADVLGNYNITYNTASFTISKRPTTLVYQGPASALYSDCVNVSAKLTDTNLGTGIGGKTIEFTMGAASATAVTGSDGVAQTLLTLDPSNLPGTSYTVSTSFAGDSTLVASSDSDSFTIKPAKVGPLAGQPVYTGNVFFWTTGPSSSTASLALSGTITDIDEVCASDIRNAKVTFAIRNTNGGYTPINGATNLPVGLMDPNNKKVGTASAIVQYNLGNANAANLDIAVIVTGGYTFNNPLYDVIVMVAKPLAGGWIVGAGKTVNGSDSSGYIAGAVGQSTDFGFDVSYNKSGTNPQGRINFNVHSYYRPDGTLGPTLRTYKVKSTAIAVLAVQAAAGTASFSSKANIVDITDPLNPISVEGNSQLQLDIKDGNLPNGAGDTIAITIYRKAGGVWFSSKWVVDKTVLMPIATGEISVK